jgi:hypothetical protein
MEYVLFLMFFTSPPSAKDHPVWTLHGTQRFEFSTMKGCKIYGKHLQEMVDSTQTMAMRGWCVDRGTGDSTYGADNPYIQNNQQPPDDANNFEQIVSKRKPVSSPGKRP